MKRTFSVSHEQRPSSLGLCRGEKMSVVKLTSKICAMLFCAMLWFNPVGAQQKTTDKDLPVLQKKAMLAQEAVAMNPVADMKVAGDMENLSGDHQMKEMVRTYMRQATRGVVKTSESDDAEEGTSVAKFIAAVDFKTQMFEISDGEVKAPTRIESLNNGTYYIYPKWGAWCKDHYEASFIYYVEAKGTYYVAYYSYDPAADILKEITSVFFDAANSPMADFDAKTEKIYVIQWDFSYNDQGGFSAATSYIYEGAPQTGAFTQKGPLSGFGDNQTFPIAMAIDKEGMMYVIATNGKFYSVNKETWAVTEIGATGISTDGYLQAAAIDYKTQQLYWSYVEVDNENLEDGYPTITTGMATVNTETGVATKIGGVELDNVFSMSSVYYVDNNPMPVRDLQLSYENSKVKATFKAPEYTENGDALTSIAKIHLYLRASSLEEVATLENPTPGSVCEMEHTPSVDGMQNYEIRVEDAHGVLSPIVEAQIMTLNITLPYQNGFEDNESTLMATIGIVDPDNLGGMERTTAEKHSGDYGFKMSGNLYGSDRRQLKIQGIPVKKDGVYQIEFWAKTNAANPDGILYAFDGAAFQYFATAYTDWSKITLEYTATATKEMTLTLQGYGHVVKEADINYFIDDIKIIDLSGAPATAVFNSVTAAADGSLKAIANITLPDKTLGGEALTSIDSIVFYWGDNVDGQVYFNTVAKVEKTNLTPGSTRDFEVEARAAGRDFLAAKLYNEIGTQRMYSAYRDENGYLVSSPWIGPDDMPSSVKVTATPNTDGTVTLSWVAAKGVHEGYLGTVTYTIKDAAGTQLYNGTELTFTTPALALGMHTLTFEMSNGTETKTWNVNTIAGIQEGMIFQNVSTSGTTEPRILNVSTGTTNSAFSQMLYPATNQAMYIDTLLLFVSAPETDEAKQYTKIYMGTTDLTAFGGNPEMPNKDFLEKEQLTEVFADTLRFKAGQKTLKLPLKGFYYNGTQSLVIGMVKPMQEATTFTAEAYGVDVESNRMKYRAVSTSIDFDTVASYNDYTGTPLAYAASMVAIPTEVKTLKVTVDSMRVAPLKDAIITIVNKGGKNMKTTLTTGSDGIVTFAYMPQGTYLVTAQKDGYIAFEQEVTIADASPVEISFSMFKGSEVNVKGSVQDKGGNKLADVAVKAVGFADFAATTDAEGVFEFQNIYAPDNYTLSFEKAGMQTLSVPFVLEEKDSTLAKIEMRYNIVAVSTASVTVEDGKAVVNWNKPETSVDPVNGYRVYRGKLQDEFKDYTLLTGTTVQDTTYTDATYATLPFGQYRYAVVADWYGDDLSAPAYTETLNKDMEFTVAFKVTSNAGSAKEAAVYMADTAKDREYEAVVNDKDTALIAPKVWRNVYNYEITLPYHKTVNGILNLTQDTVIEVALEEIVLNPELTVNVEGKDVVMTYKTEESANPTGYEIYLDGTKVKDAKADELTYTFKNLEFGEHKVGVKAIYTSGASEMVEKTVKVAAEAMPINLNVATEERTALLTWNAPEGFTPKSYKVFLGEELKAENLTEKTYTFSNLANGTYTAAVVAVYETGESEKATVEFTINSHVDVEDFDMAVLCKVYPNPTEGEFKVVAPAEARVEIFNAAGILVKRMVIAEGVAQVRLNNSGMYFVRVSASGQVAIKKVIVW